MHKRGQMVKHKLICAQRQKLCKFGDKVQGRLHCGLQRLAWRGTARGIWWKQKRELTAA